MRPQNRCVNLDVPSIASQHRTEFSRQCRGAIRELESLISAPWITGHERLVMCEARETLLKHITDLDQILLRFNPVEDDIPF
jgi:hypothetical protein